MINRNYIDLFWELVKTSFKMRYQNSLLGVLWVLIKPYTMFLVMYIIFSNIIRSGVENYPLYLLSGVIFISFINELLVLGQMSLLERANIILKVNFPRQIAIVSALAGAIINLFINLILIVFLIIITHITINIIGLVYLVFLLFTILIWASAIAFVTSLLTVQIRDLKNIIELGMFIMQYATPIFYSLDDSFIDDGIVKSIIQANPLTFLMSQFRAALSINGEINLGVTLLFFLVGMFICALSYKYFSIRVKRIAEFF